MNLAELYKLLLQQEVAEAKFKFERLLNFHKKPVQQLAVNEIEGSVITRSSDPDPAFQSFNVAKVQETSPAGIQEVVRILSGHKHILVTAPLGLSGSSLLELQSLGYGVFHHRSVLGLRLSSSESVAVSSDFHIESLESDFSQALAVLKSFHPTSRSDFDASYTYWLKENRNVRLFIAQRSAEPVAMGILSWVGSSGILSSGVVSPSARGEGIQKILIRHRIQEAQKLGLQVLFAPGVPPFSASEASLRKCGFELICTRSFWKKS
jgi:hypothetical protein